MTLKRERIVAAFESLRNLLCNMGMFDIGNETNGVFVRYWGNGNLRQLTCYHNGKPDGFEARRFGPVNPLQLRHLKEGVPYGESKSVLRSGQGIEHVLMDGDVKLSFTKEASLDFSGYLTTSEDEALYKKYAVFSIPHAFLELRKNGYSVGQ